MSNILRSLLVTENTFMFVLQYCDPLITLNQSTNIIATFKSFLLPPQTNPFPSLVSSLSS